MNDLFAKSMARVLHSGKQRVEALFPGRTPDGFLSDLVAELDKVNGTAIDELPYSIWVRKQGPDSTALQKRHIKLSGEVVSYRNNHPRILVYREGDYEPIAGVLGASRSVLPAAFPLSESDNVSLEHVAESAVQILAESDSRWADVDGGLLQEISAVLRKWAETLESMSGQELGWSDAWWRYAIHAFTRLASLDPKDIQSKGITWAACYAGCYPLPTNGHRLADASWNRLERALEAVFSDSETAQEIIDRYDAREGVNHPAGALNLKDIDGFIPLGPSENSGNQGLVLATLVDREAKCWGIVTQTQIDALVSLANGDSNLASLFAVKDGVPIALPKCGASGKKPVYLLPIAEWSSRVVENYLEVEVDGLQMTLPWLEEQEAGSLPAVAQDSGSIELNSRPSSGFAIGVTSQSPSTEGLKIELNLKIRFKVGGKWKTGPYHVQAAVLSSHPAVAFLEKNYEMRIVVPTPWGVTAVCSHGPTRGSINASGDSSFDVDEDGSISREDVGSVSITGRSAPVLADILVYDAVFAAGDWAVGGGPACPSLLVDGSRPNANWIGCWEGLGIELPQGNCIEEPDSGEVILSVDVEEPDNRPLLPLIATLQGVPPSGVRLPSSFYGEHELIAKMDQMLTNHLLGSGAGSAHGLAQVLLVSGSSRLSTKLSGLGNILWPFEHSPGEPPSARFVGSGPTDSFMQSPAVQSFTEALSKLCKLIGELPAQSDMLSRKQFKELPHDGVYQYLQAYLGMVDLARESGNQADFFWATHPCSVVLLSGSNNNLKVAASMLSPLHPVRLGWLFGCEQVFAGLDQSNAALAQVVEGWNFPAMTPGPSTAASQSAMLAIPIDPGPDQLFYGWSLLVSCQGQSPEEIRIPDCEYAGMKIPGGATSGISPSGVATALSNYLRSYPHLGGLVLEMTSRQGGQRSSSLDQAIIDTVQKLAAGKHGLSSVRVMDDPSRRGSPPSQESTIASVAGRGAGTGIERFEWVRTKSSSGDDTLTDIRFVEDAAAEFSILSGHGAEQGAGSAPAWPIRRFARRVGQDDDGCHLIQYDLSIVDSHGTIQEMVCRVVSSTERTIKGEARAVSVYANLENIVGTQDSGIQWVVVGNVGLDVATLSRLAAHGERLLWEWRPPFVDNSGSVSNLQPDLSRRSFTCIASVSRVFAGHIEDLRGMTSDLASKVLNELGARGVGLASLLSVDDKHAEGALGFYLAFDLVSRALAQVRAKHEGEINLILPMDAIDPFLRTMAAGEKYDESSRKKADLLVARISRTDDEEGKWRLVLIPVEITCRGFTNDAKSDFVGPATEGVCSKQRQLCNSHKTVSSAIKQLDDVVDEPRAAWVSALGCILEMGQMLGLPDMDSPELDLPEMVTALSDGRVEIDVHPGVLLWFAHLESVPKYKYMKLSQPDVPRERPHRAIFAAPSLSESEQGVWGLDAISATADAILCEDDAAEESSQPAAQPKDSSVKQKKTDVQVDEPEAKGSSTDEVEPTDELNPAEDATHSAEQVETTSSVGADSWWKPVLNKFGMIGQLEVISSLHSQANMAKVMQERMPDQMFVGPAGVGKSTIARKLANKLDLRLVEMNGASLRNGGDLIGRIENEELLTDPEGTNVIICPCILFIDEVHAIGSQVHDLLLSALDDRRAASHDGMEYSFENVIMLLATTDPGKLSNAFLSRPTQVVLSPYSLKELAAIVLLHGKNIFGGYEIAEEICIEIAARNQASPRQSVRYLEYQLKAYFFSKLVEDGLKVEDYERSEIPQMIGQVMSLEEVCGYFERQGIDRNGIGKPELRMLKILKEREPIAAKPLMQACGISNERDFTFAWEYTERLGLVKIVSGGRALTQLGRDYLLNPGSIDLRSRIV